jgi:putative copper resistance protein D
VFDPLIAARAVHFGATAILAGVLFFKLVIARPVLDKRSQAANSFTDSIDRIAWYGLGVALLSGSIWAILLAANIADASIAKVFGDGTLLSLITETRFGHVWLIRGGFAAIVVVVLVLRRGLELGGAAAFLMLGYLAFVGHAGARPGAVAYLQIIADMAHLLAAGFWLGALPGLALALQQAARGKIPADNIVEIISRFSLFGMVAVGALLITGIVNTWLLTDSILNLPNTTYGRLLLIKIGLFVVMVAFASVNRWYWSPRLPGAGAIAVVRRNALVELALGLLVICIVGALGTLPPPLHQHIHAEDSATEAAFVHIHDVTAMADVTVLPGRPGPSEIRLLLMKDDFTPLPAKAVSVRLSHPGQQIVVAGAQNQGDGQWRVPAIDLPVAGIWAIVVEVQTDAGPISLDAPFVLETAGSAEKQ